MVGLRSRGRAAALVIWTVVLAPLVALIAAACFDRGPTGVVRPALFPTALALLDPWVWDGIRNSLVMATAVTVAARVVGVGFARVVVGRRFWGRRPLSWLACAGLAVPPAFGAIGLRRSISDWASSVSHDAAPWGWLGIGPELAAAWWVWFWVTLAWAAPVVGLACASALRKVEPAWHDAARLAGAGRHRAWRQLVWPAVRPEVARALGVVFTLTLLEPGAPVVLGLRRTLGSQIVQAALGASEPGQLSRAAVLALVGTVLAAVGRQFIGWLGGTPADTDVNVARFDVRATAAPFAPFARASASAAALGLVGLFATWPLAVLIAEALGGGSHWTMAEFKDAAADALSRRFLLNSVALGAGVLAADLLLARLANARLGSWRGRVAGPVGWAEVVPPLAVGVGVLALPAVLGMAADLADVTGPAGVVTGPLAGWLRWASGVFDPDRTPGFALLLGVALVRFPQVARAEAGRGSRVRPSLVDAAVVLGSTPGRARERLVGGWFGVPAASAVLTWSLATTGLTPALVLAPTAETRPAGPAVLAMADEPGGLRRAAVLASGAVALNLIALAAATRDRDGLNAIRPVS